MKSGDSSARNRRTRPGLEQGDLWTYTAICADSKLLFSWLIGPRSKYATRASIRDLGSDSDPVDPTRRYSPPVCTGVQKYRIMGRPEMSKCSTSFVERNNLAVRQWMKRIARLTLGFSKSATNHAFAFAIHAMYFNYCRPHGTLTKQANGTRTTPAMAAGLTSHPWTVEDVLARMEPTFVTA